MVEAKKFELDRVDRALLRALSINARASGSALANELGVAESTVSLRLRRLQASGHIRGFRAQVDLGALGASLQALISVHMGKLERSQLNAFREAAPHWPGVISFFHVSGANDYLLHVAVADADALRDFVVNYLADHPAVTHTETSLIFEHVDGDGWQQLVR